MEYVSFVAMADVIHCVYYHLLTLSKWVNLEDSTFILSVPRDAFILVHLVQAKFKSYSWCQENFQT